MLGRVRIFLLALTRNPLSLLGAALTTASAILILTLFGVELVGYHGGPYLGILTYALLPLVFVAGLLLIPLGALWERRRARKALENGTLPRSFPVIDLNRERVRRAVLLVLAATAVNVAILAVATYKGVEVVESTEFCGTACHKVMEPEYTAYRRSPHASVRCVACHVGPGAESFAKAKLNGAGQLVSVALDRYPRPIPAPVHGMRAAAETCGACHTPARPAGDRLKVISRTAEDEKNTETKTVLLVKVDAIHWHADPRATVRFRGDAGRGAIREVSVTRRDGSAARYVSDDASKTAGTAEEGWRTMDCTDCHNRSGHVFGSPEDEVDAAFARGALDRKLPWLRRDAVELLKRPYPSGEEARRGIGEGLRGVHGKSAAADAAVEALAAIWSANVFPAMNAGWGTYPDHLGHRTGAGCFRCHDGSHVASDGATIPQDCSTCHVVLAMDEENPAILSQLAP
jgi:hypothetical protein